MKKKMKLNYKLINKQLIKKFQFNPKYRRIK